MVTKGIIKQIDFNSNICTVRIPIFEGAGNKNEMLAEATFAITPGTCHSYKANDVVLVSFEDNTYEKPIILGKLFLGTAEENESRGTINCETLIAKNAILPVSTKIEFVGDDKNKVEVEGGYKDYKTLADIIDSLKEQKTQIGSLNIKIMDNGDGLGARVSKLEADDVRHEAELMIHADKIEARVTKESDNIEKGFGWNLTDEDWTIFSHNSTFKVDPMPIFHVDASGATLSGNLKIQDYPSAVETWYTQINSNVQADLPAVPAKGATTDLNWSKTLPVKEAGKYIWELTRTYKYEFNATIKDLEEKFTDNIVCITNETPFITMTSYKYPTSQSTYSSVKINNVKELCRVGGSEATGHWLGLLDPVSWKLLKVKGWKGGASGSWQFVTDEFGHYDTFNNYNQDTAVLIAELERIYNDTTGMYTNCIVCLFGWDACGVSPELRNELKKFGSIRTETWKRISDTEYMHCRRAHVFIGAKDMKNVYEGIRQDTATPDSLTINAFFNDSGLIGNTNPTVERVVKEYYLAASSYTPTGKETTGWKENADEYKDGYIYWSRYVTYYTDSSCTKSEPTKDEGLNGCYTIAQGKVNTYYSDTDPAQLGKTVYINDIWIKTSGSLDDATTWTPYVRKLNASGTPIWSEEGATGFVAPGLLNAKYINTFDLTAKKLRVLDNANAPLFIADGAPTDGSIPFVKIAGFNVNAQSLSIGSATSEVGIRSGDYLDTDNYTYYEYLDCDGTGGFVLDFYFNPVRDDAEITAEATDHKQDSTLLGNNGTKFFVLGHKVIKIWKYVESQKAWDYVDTFITYINASGSTERYEDAQDFGQYSIFYDHSKQRAIIDKDSQTALHLSGTGLSQSSSKTGLLCRTSTTSRFKGKFWEAKIWRDGVLQFYLIPAKRKSDNKIGLYNIVNKTFLAANTGFSVSTVAKTNTVSFFAGGFGTPDAFTVSNTGEISVNKGTIGNLWLDGTNAISMYKRGTETPLLVLKPIFNDTFSMDIYDAGHNFNSTQGNYDKTAFWSNSGYFDYLAVGQWTDHSSSAVHPTRRWSTFWSKGLSSFGESWNSSTGDTISQTGFLSVKYFRSIPGVVNWPETISPSSKDHQSMSISNPHFFIANVSLLNEESKVRSDWVQLSNVWFDHHTPYYIAWAEAYYSTDDGYISTNKLQVKWTNGTEEASIWVKGDGQHGYARVVGLFGYKIYKFDPFWN